MLIPPAVADGMISVDGRGAIRLDDPASPVVVTVATLPMPGSHRRRVTEVTVAVRDAAASITPGLLGRLPIAALARLAAPHRHPDDGHWQTIARTRPARARSWPDGHWRDVAAVYRWAQETCRPGGPRLAIAEFWQVSREPTAKRWLAECRRRGLLDGQPGTCT